MTQMKLTEFGANAAEDEPMVATDGGADTCLVCGAPAEHTAHVDDPERGEAYDDAFCDEHVELAH